MTQKYTVYGGELSLFTRKLEAALQFYGAEWERVAKTQEAGDRSGTHQVPVLHTPENWVVADTTPLLGLLDSRFPSRAMFPQGPLGVLVHVIEEFLDEWVARVMVHYRWHYDESATFAAARIAQNDPQRAVQIREWGPRACRATGTESPTQQLAVEEEYKRLLAAAEAQLQRTAFLLGDRPTAVDCMVLGGLRAHTNMDPDPKRVTAQYPRVIEWSETGADAWDGLGELAPFPESTPFARAVLAEMPETYGRFALGARDALVAGDRAFVVETYGEEVSYLTRPYIERSRQMVLDRIASLGAGDRAQVEQWLGDVSLRDVFR